jgi:flagellar basal-body rod modification protein FlgD
MFTTSVTDSTTSSTDLSNVFQNDLGKEEFLRLLVAQLQNQDPLSPLEGQEFASQLAQFSSVEQLTSIDSTIQESVESDQLLSQTINNTLATSLIGKQVTAIGNQIELKGDGTEQDVYFRLASDASSVTVNIMDAAGNVVRTLEGGNLTTGVRSLSWDGTDGDGNDLPEGTYTFEVAAQSSDGTDVAAEELVRGIAGSLQFAGGYAVLKIGDIEIGFGDVLEISSGLGG